MDRLVNKRILLGVTGGIAAYKSADLVRRLQDAGADVRVVMTKSACEFITPLTMQALSGHPVHTDLLDPEAEAAMGHIELARWADLVLIAPASANFMARLAHGHGSDLLSTVCLATADKEGHPSARMVLLKEISARGFKFHTNADSHKGQDIRGNPYAALCLYWKSTRKQIRIEGRVEQAGEDEADEYFATRSIERKIGAWASKQSTPFAHRAEMEEAVKKYEAEFAGADHIPRPPYWKGYRVIPVHIEFWIAHEARL